MTGFTARGADLAEAVSFTVQVIPSRPSEPALGGVLIEVGESSVRFVASDYVLTAWSQIDTTGLAVSGQLLASGRLLDMIATSAARESEVRCQLTDDELVITAGRSSWTLPTLDALHYPEVRTAGPELAHVDAHELANALAAVLPAAGAPGEPPMLGGVSISALNGDRHLTLAATDRYRLGVAEIAWSGSEDLALPDTLVPGEVATLARAAARRQSEQVDQHVGLHLDGRGIALVGENFGIAGPVLASENPGIWRRVDAAIGETVTTVLVATEALREAVDRAALVLEPNESIVVEFTPDPAEADGLITVTPGVGNRGRAEVVVGSTHHDGPGYRIGVNNAYLKAGLAAVGNGWVLIECAARPWAPFRLTLAESDGTPVPGYHHVIAQQRVASPVQAS